MCCTAGTCSTWAVTSRWVSEEQAFSASRRSFISTSVGTITPRKHRKRIAPKQQPLLMAGCSRSAVCCLPLCSTTPTATPPTTRRSSNLKKPYILGDTGNATHSVISYRNRKHTTGTGQAQVEGRARWCTSSWEVNTSTVAPTHSSSAQTGRGRTLI